MSRGNVNTAGIQAARAEQAEAHRIAVEKIEADCIAAEKAETDPVAHLAAQSISDTHDDSEGGAGGYVQGENDVSLPAAGVFPKRGPVRVLAQSDTNAVVTDDVEQWTVALADGDPTKATPPSLLLREEQQAEGTATPAPQATAPVVVGQSDTHRILDDGVRRWKEEIA